MNPVYQLATASPDVLALLGTTPTRFYPFGEAEEGVETPYAVWQLVYGSPYNLLGDAPREDSFGIQIDCYADTGDDASELSDALRESFEGDGYVVAFNGEWREADTRLFRVSFTVAFISARATSDS